MNGDGSGLVVEELSKSYGDVDALSSVSIAVRHREVVALLGNNGAGKSTLMSICAGLVRPDSGSVSVEGVAVTAGRGTSRHLGLAPQEEALYPTLSVRRNLEYFATLGGLRGAEVRERVEDVARRMMIDGLLDRSARTLSGGQRRRLHTGLALMHAPSVLCLDEPTVGVDIDARAQLLSFVRTSADDGVAILYSTHQLHEVEALDARVVIIDRGQVLATGSVHELVSRHAHPVAELRFAGAAPQLPAALAARLDELPTAHGRSAGPSTLVLRLASEDTTASELVDQLDDIARAALLAVAVSPPSLEQAYVRITRRATT